MRVVFATCSPEEAAGLVRQLVEEGLAACGNILPGARSIYRWKGEICDETEAVLLLETTEARLPQLMQRMARLHSYDTPKILAWEPAEGHGDYMRWVASQTTTRTGE